MLKIAINILY